MTRGYHSKNFHLQYPKLSDGGTAVSYAPVPKKAVHVIPWRTCTKGHRKGPRAMRHE